MNKRVLIISSSYMRIDCGAFPQGADNEGADYSANPGGIGITAAVTFRALGLDSIFCSAVGEDVFGSGILKFVSTVGVDKRFVKSCKNARTGLIINIQDPGSNTRTLRFRSANNNISRSDIDAAFMVYPDALYIQNELSDELTSYAVNIAKSKGIPVFFNPCSEYDKKVVPLSAKFEAAVFEACDVGAYCGIVPDSYDKFLPAAMALASKIKAKYHIIHIPGRGAFIYDGIHHDMAAEYDSSEIDFSGSSAVYGAAFTSAYIKTGGNINKAAKCAAAAYAYSTSHKGEVSSVPSVTDLVSYIKNY